MFPQWLAEVNRPQSFYGECIIYANQYLEESINNSLTISIMETREELGAIDNNVEAARNGDAPGVRAQFSVVSAGHSEDAGSLHLWTNKLDNLWVKVRIPHADWASAIFDSNSNELKLFFSKGFEDYIAIFEGCNATTLIDARIFNANFNLHRRKISINSVAPHSFYGLTEKKRIEENRFFKSFSRQDSAFQCCDRFIDKQLKVFSFESEAENGRRRFLVSDIFTFVSRYSELAMAERHVYEIIREGYPCRLYFDIEYSIKLNPTSGNIS